jgi:TrmH family RNA methyltransferase
MTPITSPHNPRLKELRKLHRRRERERSKLFLAEGEDLIQAAADFGRSVVEGYRVPGRATCGTTTAVLAGERFHEVDAQALAAVSTLGSGTRAIGVYEQRWGEPCGPLCVYLHGVGDPGNVGTVLRGALAFGASCVALGPGCADPHSPKAVRASMGAIFAVALARVSDVARLPGERIALLAHGGAPLWQIRAIIAQDTTHDGARAAVRGDRVVLPEEEARMPEATAFPLGAVEKRALTLLVGAERDGLPDDLVAACEHAGHIPISGGESLNAAMAATVALYEMTRPSSRVPAS